MVHKCLNSNVPEYISNPFTRSDHIPALRTVQGQRSFGYTGSKDFNSIPLKLKSIKEYINIVNVKPKSISATCCVMNIEY